MSTFVGSLQRLYKAGKVTIIKLDELINASKLTKSEYDYIIQ